MVTVVSESAESLDSEAGLRLQVRPGPGQLQPSFELSRLPCAAAAPGRQRGGPTAGPQQQAKGVHIMMPRPSGDRPSGRPAESRDRR